jgi:hypothetical protein
MNLNSAQKKPEVKNLIIVITLPQDDFTAGAGCCPPFNSSANPQLQSLQALRLLVVPQTKSIRYLFIQYSTN